MRSEVTNRMSPLSIGYALDCSLVLKKAMVSRSNQWLPCFSAAALMSLRVFMLSPFRVRVQSTRRTPPLAGVRHAPCTGQLNLPTWWETSATTAATARAARKNTATQKPMSSRNCLVPPVLSLVIRLSSRQPRTTRAPTARMQPVMRPRPPSHRGPCSVSSPSSVVLAVQPRRENAAERSAPLAVQRGHVELAPLGSGDLDAAPGLVGGGELDSPCDVVCVGGPAPGQEHPDHHQQEHRRTPDHQSTCAVREVLPGLDHCSSSSPLNGPWCSYSSNTASVASVYSS